METTGSDTSFFLKAQKPVNHGFYTSDLSGKRSQGANSFCLFNVLMYECWLHVPLLVSRGQWIPLEMVVSTMWLLELELQTSLKEQLSALNC